MLMLERPMWGKGDERVVQTIDQRTFYPELSLFSGWGGGTIKEGLYGGSEGGW